MANLNLIKILAEKKNIRITELAEAVGLSEQQMHLIVRKNSTKIETLEKIAKVLGVPVTFFFDELAAGKDADGVEMIYGVENVSPAVEKELREQIAVLKSHLEDKERIIRLMEEKLNEPER